MGQESWERKGGSGKAVEERKRGRAEEERKVDGHWMWRSPNKIEFNAFPTLT